MSTRTDKQQRGFTLLELLVVVMILALFASVAGVTASDTSAMRLDGAELQVRDGLELAQAMALANRRMFGVAFEVGGGRFAIVGADGNPIVDPLTQRDYIVDYDRPGPLSGVLIRGVNFGATRNTVVFDAQGVPITGGTVTISHDKLSRTLMLDAGTGRIGGS